MQEGFHYDVFLSHHSGDKPRVRRLAEQLRALGLRVWFDEWVVQPGDDIYLQIERGLETTRTLILCLSPAALGSDWVGLERSTVLFRDPTNKDRRFIPLLLDNCTMPDTLRRYKYVDYRQEDEIALAALLAACRNEIGTLTPSVQAASEEMPEPIKTLLDEAKMLSDRGHNAAARVKLEEALRLAEARRHPLAEIKAKRNLATVLRADDPGAARTLYQECLEQLRSTPSEQVQEEVLAQLGDLETIAGNIVEARALLTEAVEIGRRLEDRSRIASNTQSLALLAASEGRTDDAIRLYDEAIVLFMAEYQRHDPATEYRAMRGLGVCFNNKSLAEKRQADLVGSLTSVNQAVTWFRQCDSRDDLAKALFLLAEAKFADAKWQEGAEHLTESLKIATELDDYLWMSQCLTLSGRLNYMLGRETESEKDIEGALGLVRERGTPSEVIDCLGRMARIYATKGLKDQARALLDEVKVLSERHELLEDYADCILDLAKLEEDDENGNEKREDAARTAIRALEHLLLKTQVKGRRAFLMGRIGSLHQRLGNREEALSWFQRAQEIFLAIGDVPGIANCLGSIAEIRHDEDQLDDELDAYREILTLTRGKPMPHLIAGTKINMGNALVSHSSFREAKELFEEAAEICNTHHIRDFGPAILGNLERVQHFLDAYKPAAVDLKHLVHELHDLVAFFPEAQDSILRFWYYTRDAELHANCRSLGGVKLFIVEDDTVEFLKLTDKIGVYGDLYLQVVNTKFAGSGIDFVPYPKDRPLPKRVAVTSVREDEAANRRYIEFLRGGLHWRYSVTSDEASSKASGQTGIVIFGRAGGLPPQAHDLMLGHTADDLIRKRVLFFPFERAAPEERLLNDLKLTKEQTLIPLYKERLPDSDDVEVVTSVAAHLPVLQPAVAVEFRPQVSAAKRRLVRLLSMTEKASVDALSDTAAALEELCHQLSRAEELIPVTLYLLRFTVLGRIEHQPALVYHNAGIAG
jgi:tetratricopeptide (TPR) repeat protein